MPTKKYWLGHGLTCLTTCSDPGTDRLVINLAKPVLLYEEEGCGYSYIYASCGNRIYRIQILLKLITSLK